MKRYRIQDGSAPCARHIKKSHRIREIQRLQQAAKWILERAFGVKQVHWKSSMGLGSTPYITQTMVHQGHKFS